MKKPLLIVTETSSGLEGFDVSEFWFKGMFDLFGSTFKYCTSVPWNMTHTHVTYKAVLIVTTYILFCNYFAQIYRNLTK